MITPGENTSFSSIKSSFQKSFHLAFISALVLICLVMSSVSVKAQEVSPSDNGVVLDKQVVSATGLLTDIDDTPIHTEVITAKQLEFMQAKVLTEALRYSPGLKVRQTVKKGSKLTMQGIDANYVLILKDGLPFVSPTGSETDLSQISLAGIDRIEIIKGSGSALYGSSAMGGVINLISKESDVNQIEIDIKQGAYQSGADGFKQEQSLFASKVLGRSKISTQIFHKKTPEIDLDDSTEAADGAMQDLTNVELRFDQRHGDEAGLGGSSFVRINYMQDEKLQTLDPIIYPGQGNFANEYQTQSNKITLDAGIRQFKYSWLDQGSVNFRYENYSEQSGNKDGLKGELNQREVDIALYKVESQFNNHFYHSQYQNTLSYGISAQLNQMAQNKLEGITEVDDKESSTIEAYAQSHVMTAHYGEFVPGIRVQNDSDFGFYPNAKLNWMKDVNLFDQIESKLRLSYGQGYRTPDLKQRFYLFDHSNLGYIIQGNEDLEPEESNNYNMTLTLKNDNARLEWSAFYNQYRNKIETVSNGIVDNVEQYQYENVGEAITQGQELTLALHPVENMYWQQSITYLDTENIDTGKRLEGQPLWSYKTQFNYSVTHKLIMSLYGSIEYDTYNGQYDSDGDDINDTDIEAVTQVIQIWDVKDSYRIINEVNLYTSIDNLFDAKRSINYDTVAEIDERTIESKTFNFGINIVF
ncbi:MAG: TonB-dependent receptor [Oleispira sp.]|nr:TonB-dependent receptor [Oleispira sp.]